MLVNFSMSTLRYFLIILATTSVCVAEESGTGYTATDIVIEDSRIELKKEATQSIDVTTKVSSARPTLESALDDQSNIQVVPSPLLRGSNLTLNGLHGEHVAIYRDGDPLLGRIDGSLDARSVALGNIDRISVYQGLDSLPYGSQNIGGVISLESPWAPERVYRLRSAGGTQGRMVFGLKGAGEPTRDHYYSVSVDNWRSEAVAGPQIDTAIDASANLAVDALVARARAAVLKGENVDLRVGGSGFQSHSKGVFGEAATTGEDRRVHVFADARRGKSDFHLSYNEARHRWRQDDLTERSVRVGPELHETSGDFTWLAGAMADVRTTQSSRMTRGRESATTLGTYAGTRYALSESWVVGAGTRYDTGPRLFSPRAEVRHLGTIGAVEHTTVLESGLGFREPTAKERYFDFANRAVGYRIVGNADLKTEEAWMTALRHTARSKKLTMRGSVFEIDLRDAIGTQAASDTDGALKYANISRTRTYGFEFNGDYELVADVKFLMGYQWLRGHNLEADSDLFLQPRNRLTLGVARDFLSGLSGSARAVWTGRQGFFDYNRNRKIDDGEWAASYWMASLDLGYGFRWDGVAEMMRIFGRVDNSFDLVRPESFPIEPRSFLVGATVDL